MVLTFSRVLDFFQQSIDDIFLDVLLMIFLATMISHVLGLGGALPNLPLVYPFLFEWVTLWSHGPSLITTTHHFSLIALAISFHLFE